MKVSVAFAILWAKKSVNINLSSARLNCIPDPGLYLLSGETSYSDFSKYRSLEIGRYDNRIALHSSLAASRIHEIGR